MPIGSSGNKKERDYFSRRGGGSPLSTQRIGTRLRRARLRPRQKEYVKQVMKQYDYPGSKGVTKEEFHKGLDRMKKNSRDGISKSDVERIKKAFK